jgi:hypothetical protein
MTGNERIRRAYTIEVRPGSEGQSFRISYLPRGLQQERGPGGKPKPVPEFHATVQSQGGRKTIQWDQRPTDPEAGPEDFDKDARHRVKLLQEWLKLLAGLMSKIRGWATELDWSTKELDKPLADSEIGSYRVPVLLMQQETIKVLLEPVARSSPGSAGVVDLYLLPGYDDIASLYYDANRWNLHYIPHEEPPVGNIREAKAIALSKDNLGKVLDEMKQNAEAQ